MPELRHAEGCGAFTLIELVAILAIIGMVAAVALSARAGAKDQSQVAQCSGNLRQFAVALQVYAEENSDKLPNNQNVGYWAWDMPWAVGVNIVQYLAPPNSAVASVSWRTLYCPGTGWRLTDADNYRLWNYNPGVYRILGYAATFPNTVTLNPTNANPTLTPQPIPYLAGYLPTVKASQRVLVADGTISSAGQNNPSLKATYNWTDIPGFNPHQTSAHLEGPLPLGGNVAMLDGHVEWRKLAQMLPRTTGTSVPVFWW